MTEISYHKSNVVQGNNNGTIINNFGTIDSRKNTLPIIVVAGTESEYQHLDNSTIPLQNYGKIPENWKPYHTEKDIINLLREFEEKSNLKIDIYFVYNFDMENEDHCFNLSHRIAPKVVLILDIFAMVMASKFEFAKLFDKQKDIGGFVVPLCHSLSHEQKTKAIQMQEKFRDVRIAFQKKFDRQYMFIDLDIPHKFLLFRRLADIAFMYLGLEEGGDKLDKELEAISKKAPNKDDL